MAKNFYREEIRISYSKTENATRDLEDLHYLTVGQS